LTFKLTLRAHPRLHFGLIDLSGATSRAYGGIGVAFSGPTSVVEATVTARFELELNDADDETRNKVTTALLGAEALGLRLAGHLRLVRHIPSHVGLGSTTATTLAILMSVAKLNAWQLDNHRFVWLSGRGRTSAIGCHTFLDGGLVADAGQPGHPAAGASYLPSLLPGGRGPSLRLGRWAMPDRWVVYLLFVKSPPSIRPGQEPEFFAARTPTSKSETLQQLAAVYHGIVPAVLEQDLTQFALALRQFQTLGFKAHEIHVQPDHVQNTLTRLWNRGFAAGLSSLGPTVFVVSDGPAVDIEAVVPAGERVAGPFEFRHEGFDHVITAADGTDP
jgi:beta-ribofuranosylaminobenzene 5'-phosphate synthase